MKPKFRLTEETKEWCGRTLHRIEALRDFDEVRVGDKGGWIEQEENLTHTGNAWIHYNAKVYDCAQICNNAQIWNEACVYGNAVVCGNAWVSNNAKVYGIARVYGEAQICGDAKVYQDTDYIIFKNWWSSGCHFTWTRSNNKWAVGCFHGTGEELIKEAYADSEISGREYERVVKYVKSILADMEFVSLELVERLKDKGFNWAGMITTHNPVTKGYHNCFQYTISQVLTWLRKEKQIHVIIPAYSKDSYWWEIRNFNKEISEYTDVQYNSYNEAATAAIIYILDNLILLL